MPFGQRSASLSVLIRPEPLPAPSTGPRPRGDSRLLRALAAADASAEWGGGGLKAWGRVMRVWCWWCEGEERMHSSAAHGPASDGGGG
jgi:hypothetical protein